MFFFRLEPGEGKDAKESKGTREPRASKKPRIEQEDEKEEEQEEESEQEEQEEEDEEQEGEGESDDEIDESEGSDTEEAEADDELPAANSVRLLADRTSQYQNLVVNQLPQVRTNMIPDGAIVMCIMRHSHRWSKKRGNAMSRAIRQCVEQNGAAEFRLVDRFARLHKVNLNNYARLTAELIKQYHAGGENMPTHIIIPSAVSFVGHMADFRLFVNSVALMGIHVLGVREDGAGFVCVSHFV